MIWKYVERKGCKLGKCEMRIRHGEKVSMFFRIFFFPLRENVPKFNEYKLTFLLSLSLSIVSSSGWVSREFVRATPIYCLIYAYFCVCNRKSCYKYWIIFFIIMSITSATFLCFHFLPFIAESTSSENVFLLFHSRKRKWKFLYFAYTNFSTFST